MIYNVINHTQNEHFDKLSRLSPHERMAELFKIITDTIPIYINEDDLIAGWYGYKEDLGFDNSAPHFENSTNFFTEELAEKRDKLRYLNTHIEFTRAHTCLDYKTVIEKGIEHYLKKVDAALEETPENQVLLAMKSELLSVCHFAERYRQLAKEKSAAAKSAEERRVYEKIYNSLCQVPLKNARTFAEAVQSLWILHALIPIAELEWGSISIGRIDQFLYPLYKKHIADGGSREEAKAILKNFFYLLNTYGDGACAMNIGGSSSDGAHQYNELSKLLIEVEKEVASLSPIFAVRVTPDMPDDIMDSLVDLDLFKIGQPTFYGENTCRRSMLDRGVEPFEAIDFSANSCMGIIAQGKEFADMWGIKFNAHLPLELAVNRGRPLMENHSYFDSKVAPAVPKTFDELMLLFQEYMDELLSVSTDIYECVAKEIAETSPGPLLSALTEGCIESRSDRAVGAKYNNVTVETFGLINVCDSLLAIKELVYDKKKYSLEYWVKGAQSNYEGYEKLLNDISECDKYGSDSSDSIGLCSKVCDIVYNSCKKNWHHNRRFFHSLHTIDVNVSFGRTMYATLDGRKKGTPVNKNANPFGLVKNIAYTSLASSAAKLPQYKFSGGQPIDLYFDESWFKTKEMRDKIKHLILTYFDLGGMQLQVNSADIELLEKAHKEPNKYPFVIVRRGGYSVRFNELSPAVREDMIAAAKNFKMNNP